MTPRSAAVGRGGGGGEVVSGLVYVLPDGTRARLTERVMLGWLRDHRYCGAQRNGHRWVFASHVPDAAGFDACRTADAVAMDMWASTGRELHGHEVKVSRADWLRELRQPDKAQAVAKFMDRWWLVVPDAAIVRDGELPAWWGMLVLTAEGCRVLRRAPKLRPEPLSRNFVAGLVRAAMETAYADSDPTATPAADVAGAGS